MARQPRLSLKSEPFGMFETFEKMIGSGLDFQLIFEIVKGGFTGNLKAADAQLPSPKS